MEKKTEKIEKCILSINDRPTLFVVPENGTVYVAFRDISANFTRDPHITPEDNLFGYADVKRNRKQFGQRAVLAKTLEQKPDHWNKNPRTAFVKVKAVCKYLVSDKTASLRHPLYPEELAHLLERAERMILTEAPATPLFSTRYQESKNKGKEKETPLFDLVKKKEENKSKAKKVSKTLREVKQELEDKLKKDVGSDRDQLLAEILAELKTTNKWLDNIHTDTQHIRVHTYKIVSTELKTVNDNLEDISGWSRVLSGQVGGIRKALFGPLTDTLTKLLKGKNEPELEIEGEGFWKKWFKN